MKLKLRKNLKNKRDILNLTPVNFNEVKEIANQLINGNPILLDVNKIGKEDAVRTIDILTGVLMVTNGNYHEIDEKKYLLVPIKDTLDMYLESTTQE